MKTKVFIDFESIHYPDRSDNTKKVDGPYAMTIGIDNNGVTIHETTLFDPYVTAYNPDRVKNAVNYFLVKNSLSIIDVLFVVWGGSLEKSILQRCFGEEVANNNIHYLDRELGVLKANSLHQFGQSHVEMALKINIDNGIKEFIESCNKFPTFPKLKDKLKMDSDGRIAYVLGVVYASFVNKRPMEKTMTGRFAKDFQKLVNFETVQEVVAKYNMSDVIGMIEIHRRLPLTNDEKMAITEVDRIEEERIQAKADWRAFSTFKHHFDKIADELRMCIGDNNEFEKISCNLLERFESRIAELDKKINSK